MYIEGRGDSFIDDYVDIAKKLKYCGASKICICCNTAHYAIEEIENKAGIEIINLIENVALRVKSITDIKSVGIVVTDGCIKGRVYEKYFSRICPDVKIIYPDIEYQKLSTKGICNIKNFHRFDDINSTENPFNIFKKVKNHLLEKGADKVIMGCTDIRVGYFEKENIDSLEVLKDTILKEFS